MRGGFEITEPRGQRWDLALELLREGVQAVVFDAIVFRRDVHGPTATGRVVVSIPTAYEPRMMTTERGCAEVDRGKLVVEHLRREDERFDQLLADYGTTWEYVYDYAVGSILLATATDDGTLHWLDDWRPSA